MKNRTTINFLYFLSNYNSSSLQQQMVYCFGYQLGNHFYDKYKSKVTNLDGTKALRQTIMDMSDDNKDKFINHVSETYAYDKIIE